MRQDPQFSIVSRLLHWLMAVLVLAMLFIGVGMVSTVSERYRLLVSIHEPIGMAILVLIVIRILNRLISPPPLLPADMPQWQKFAAQLSHLVLYVLMLLLPLVGWAMLSAARYPIMLFGGFVLPPILPHDATLAAGLRRLHTWLALLLFATFLAHLGAALFHKLIRRDGVFTSMMPWRARRAAGPAEAAEQDEAATQA